MRFYRYIIYRLYSWRLEQKDNTPGTTVELMMCLTHYMHILTLYSISVYFWPSLDVNLSKIHVLLIAFGIQFAYHFLVYDKKKWMGYIGKFKDESEAKRKSGTILLYAYVIGSGALFFVLLPILFGG